MENSAAAIAAKYHLMLDFHGTSKPAGLNQTYPNVVNFEGVAGLENLKWAPESWDMVQYDCELPFIRQVAGPMDYTQGAMINAACGTYHPNWSEPMSQGTRCHQLALYIVFESPLNMALRRTYQLRARNGMHRTYRFHPYRMGRNACAGR